MTLRDNSANENNVGHTLTDGSPSALSVVQPTPGKLKFTLQRLFPERPILKLG